MSRRLIVSAVCVAFLCASGVAVAVHAGTGSAESSRGVCLKHPRRVTVGHGRSPSGQKWYVVGHLRNDGRCHTRLLEVSFHPWGTPSTVWGAGYGVPIGGSLSSTFVISSNQLKGTGAIAYGGVTSRRVALVEAFTRRGGWAKIKPQLPQLSSPPSWLRNVCFFMEYLPGKVERIRVRDRAGHVLYAGRESVLGEFDDVGVL
jgi:hypothetical protein